VNTSVGLALILSLSATIAAAAAEKTVRAVLQPVETRKTAPAFRLPAASGKVMSPASFRGKVLLLDFWATECGGCKAETPYFMEFDRAYKAKGLAVVGVSLDILSENLKDADEGWSRVKPFVREHKLNYPILMGDDPVSKLYDIQAMPVTCLIDKQGRVAATYIGIVDKQDIESNIRALLRE
jgi:peroxiredoxin